MIFHLKFFFFRIFICQIIPTDSLMSHLLVLFGGKSTTWPWHNTPSCITDSISVCHFCEDFALVYLRRLTCTPLTSFGV